MSDQTQIDADSAVFFKQAMQLHQLGIYDRAARLYARVLEKFPQHKQAMYLYNRLRRHNAAASSSPWRVVWQHEPSGLWDEDWLDYLLADVPKGERVVDTKHSVFFDKMIVVDRNLSAAAEPYYANASFQGSHVVLFHLADEWYTDDYACYTWCDRVFRNHWTFMHAENRKVMFFPLGYKTGFSSRKPSKPAAERRYLWSFMGDANKSSRQAMLKAVQGIGESFVHLTSGWNSPDALPTQRYREVMDESIFVPAPCGWQNLESFRAWEALEAGCIPIVERRPQFDYFATLCGDYPFPSISDWSQAADFLKKDLAELEQLRQRCSAWWQAHKADIRSRIGTELLGLSAATAAA
ncbi:MAG: exostosin family protein [Steroidobacteraceae bacterium]|jgi:hypothetical protein